MRIAVTLPLTFIALAATEIWWTWQFREFQSPVPGFVAGSIVMVTASRAIHTIWSVRASAPANIAISGACAFGLGLALPLLFPIVRATTEEATLVERVRYPVGLAAIVLCTILSAGFARRSLRRKPWTPPT
jgi:hypothetical protein